jgi:hypothetical protein
MHQHIHFRAKGATIELDGLVTAAFEAEVWVNYGFYFGRTHIF